MGAERQVLLRRACRHVSAAGKEERRRVGVGLRARDVLANGRLGARCARMERVVLWN